MELRLFRTMSKLIITIGILSAIVWAYLLFTHLCWSCVVCFGANIAAIALAVYAKEGAK